MLNHDPLKMKPKSWETSNSKRCDDLIVDESDNDLVNNVYGISNENWPLNNMLFISLL